MNYSLKIKTQFNLILRKLQNHATEFLTVFFNSFLLIIWDGATKLVILKK